MRVLSRGFALVALSGAAVSHLGAQSRRFIPRPETGVEVGGLSSHSRGRSSFTTIAYAARLEYPTPSPQWGVGLRVSYMEHTTPETGRVINVGININLQWMLPIGDFAESHSGPYLTGGPTLSLSTPDIHTPTARAYGINGGVGWRIALGKVAAIRTEVAAIHDPRSSSGNAHYPAATRIGARVAISVLP